MKVLFADSQQMPIPYIAIRYKVELDAFLEFPDLFK